MATLDTLNGWTYEKAAAELGSRWGLGGNDMLLLLVKDSDYYVALGDNVLDAMTDTYQAGLQGAVEAPYYQGDYDAAALAFFRQADVFYAQTLGRQQSGGSYSDYEDNGAWQGNDSGSVAAVVLLVVGIFVVWILLDGLRYRRYRRRPVVVGGPVYYPVFWGRHPRPPRRPAPPRGPRPPMGGGPRPPMGGGPRPPMGGGPRPGSPRRSTPRPSRPSGSRPSGDDKESIVHRFDDRLLLMDVQLDLLSGHDGLQHIGQAGQVEPYYAHSQHDVEQRHEGHQLFAHAADALDAAQQHHGHHHGHHHAHDEVDRGQDAVQAAAIGQQGRVDGCDDGVDLGLSLIHI